MISSLELSIQETRPSISLLHAQAILPAVSRLRLDRAQLFAVSSLDAFQPSAFCSKPG